MYKNRNNHVLTRTEKGFTLIEMIIVATIIGILSGVVISLVNPQRANNRAKDSVRVSHLGKIAKAAESYANLEGTYPENWGDLDDSAYMSTWPNGSPDPNDVYIYTFDSATQTFTVSVESSSGRYLKYFSSEGTVLDCPAAGSDSVDCDPGMPIPAS